MHKELIEQSVGARKEYVVHAKLKNNLILSRILQEYKNVSEFCRIHDLSPSEVGNLINMRVPAMKTGRAYYGALDCDMWTACAVRLADALSVHPSELFTEEQATAQLKTNEAFIELSNDQALSIADPLKQVENKQLVEILFDAARLDARQRAICLMKADGVSLADLARMHQISPARVSEIEKQCHEKIKLICHKKKHILGTAERKVLNVHSHEAEPSA